jgi:phage terminase large subunit
MEATANIEVAPRIDIRDKRKLWDALGYKAHHPEVERFHESSARIKVACGPRRSTKSYASAHDAIPMCCFPGRRIWIVGPNYTVAEKEFRYIHEKLVLKRNVIGLPKPKTCLTNPRSGQLYMKFDWGTIVEGKSADKPAGLLGEAVDYVIYSEAAQLQRQIRERYVQPTVVTRKGIEVIPTTPDQAGEWVLELFEKGNNPYYDDVESFHWDIRANPTFDVDEFNRAKKLYGENSPVFREQYLGEWVFYGGRVYHNWREDLHVIDPFDIPRSWPVIRAIDFGHRDPFVCLWGAVGPTGEIYIFREYYNRKGEWIKEHASEINRLSNKLNIRETVADPSAAQSIEDLSYEGIACNKAERDIAAGRLRVLQYLAPSEDNTPPFPFLNLPAALSRREWPKLYVFSTCKELRREMKYYRWREGRSIEGEKERTEGEDHAMDALRYLAMTRPAPLKMRSDIPRGSWMHHKNRMTASRVGGGIGG